MPMLSSMLSPLSSSRIVSSDHHHYSDMDTTLVVPPAADEQQQDRIYSSSFYPPAMCHHQGPIMPDGYAFMAAAQSCLLVKSEHQTLPSPPLAPGDLDGGRHDYQGLPMGAISFHAAAEYPVSPEAWSPVLVQDGEELMPMTGLDSSFAAMDHMGSMTPTYCPGVLSPDELVIKTAPVMTMKSEVGPMGIDDVPEIQAARPVKDGKLDEPYAQLIYRAFMSRSDHAMTLQDIYQWFRDNTNKAVTEKGGWQNSIRHNLSMNAAFTKRHRKADGGDFRCLMEDAKRSNEWVLEDWAVCYGVQSTTRYRKGNPRRRTGTRSANLEVRQRTQHSAKRAVSGRKGGCAARDSRLRDRSCHRRRSATSTATTTTTTTTVQLSSPPRSIVPDLYSAESFAVSQAVCDRARTIHHQHRQQMLRPQGTPDFGMMTLTSPDQDPSVYSQAGFPYPLRDVYSHGDQLCVDTAYDWSDSGGS
ncbi:forkhead domain-containing protein [Ophiocordyceps camponoti-floridani]|uniref:Forkhead domain-containing protein n=1 Tax=Ophiocordyceps camponoti-floridani TaxID=2030778 RepID=A0A8H4QAY3_9HYPO|nr:forkhead domain-containing protein [Ophiocordyceps camponoti-floridani]